MKINTYTVEVYRKNDKPVFCLAINSTLVTGVRFFTDMQTLKNRILFEKDSLRKYGIELQFDSDFLTKSDNHFAIIQEFLQADYLQIHNKSGNSYDVRKFPTEQDYENYFLFGVYPNL